MPTFKQIRFPEIVTTEGSFRLIINREGAIGLTQAASDTLTLDQSLRIIGNEGWEFSQEESDEEGFPVADSLDIVLLDRKNYSGVSNGSPVSESISSFVYDRLFTDDTIKYRAWIIRSDTSGSEKISCYSIDPLTISDDHLSTFKEYTVDEEVFQVCRFSLISAVEDLRTARMSTVKSSITTSDCLNAEFYTGITTTRWIRSPWDPFVTGQERGLIPMSGWIHASPYWQDARGPDHDWSNLAGLAPLSDGGHGYKGCASAARFWNLRYPASPTPDISKGGSWGIKISKIVEKIASAANMEFTPSTDMDSSLDFLVQSINNANKEWDVNSTRYAATDLYVSYNVWFGVHILNGANWNNPIRFQPNETCLNALNRIADFLLADLRFKINPSTGAPIIKFIAKGSSTGTIPTKWKERLADSKSDGKESICDYVTVHNKQDDTKIKCPAGAQGESREYITPFRIRPWGGVDKTNPAWLYGVCPGFTEFDGKLKIEERYKAFFVGSFNSNTSGDPNIDGPFIADDYWRGLCYAYVYLTGSNPMYPSNWKSINNNTTWDGLYNIALVIPKNASIPTKSEVIASNYKQFNSRDTHAQYFAKEKVGLRSVITRTNIGILADDGTFGGIDIGNTASFKFKGATTSFRLAAIRRTLKPLTSEVKLIESITFPTITELATEEDGDNANTTTSSNNSTTTIINNVVEFSDVFRVRTRKVKLFSGGAVQKTFDQIVVFEAYDSTNSRWVAQYGMLQQYDAQTGATYGANSLVFFHYLGTADKGNCFIDGLSPSSPETPDYWFSFYAQFKHGTNDTDITYSLQQGYWSEDANAFLFERLLERANNKRRLHVAGRFKIDMTSPGIWGPMGAVTWEDFTTTWDFSNDDCKSNIDKGYFGTAPALPAITGVAGTGTVILTWDPRYKPVTIETLGWGFNPLDAPGSVNAQHDWQLGTNPCKNRVPTINDIEISFWLNDWAAAVGARHLSMVTASEIDAQPALDYIIVTFWGEIEVVGENASAA